MTDITNLPALYSVTGDIKDINTLLISRAEAVRLNAPAVPVGMVLVPVQATPDMCKAAVIYANGNAVYKNVAHEALEIEERIYSEVYDAMLSAAPAAPQPAQPLTDEQANCWCESCDLAKGDPCGRTRMSICPNCGDKRCPRAKHHDNECQQAHGIGVKND